MEPKFFRTHAVYQIYPRSFSDSNGDGIGDIPGIIAKLDYLKELGIGIIWLSPVYKSPNDDIGYDISDYCAINPEYGTMADMDRLIQEAGKRGIRIIMDLVVNHTSDEHPWFIASKKEGSPYRAYYYWRKGRNHNKRPPNNWQSMFSGPAWTYVPGVGLWYLHLYGEKQPDLDWHNPKVKEEVEKILRFWLDKGIYGFRCDVINQIWKTSLADGRPRIYGQGMEHYLNQPGNHRILRELNRDVFSKYDAMTVGECYLVTLEAAHKFTHGELDMCFQFEHVGVDKSFIPVFRRKYRPRNLRRILLKWQENLDWNANYFENHDQARSVERFGDAKFFYDKSAKMLATLLTTLRGTTFIYQGEEIGTLNNHFAGMEEINDVSAHRIHVLLKKLFPWLKEEKIMRMIDVNNRDHARAPMQWDDGPHGGFTTGTPWIKENALYKSINVKRNLADPDSIFHYYQKLLALKRKYIGLCLGDFRALKVSGDLFAYTRDYGEEEFTVLLNLGGKARKNTLYLKGEVLISNYGRDDLSVVDRLKPYEAAVVRTRGKRSPSA